MSLITPKQLFIQDRLAAGCDREDILWLADMQFTEDGEVKLGTIADCYQRPQ